MFPNFLNFQRRPLPSAPLKATNCVWVCIFSSLPYIMVLWGAGGGYYHKQHEIAWYFNCKNFQFYAPLYLSNYNFHINKQCLINILFFSQNVIFGQQISKSFRFCKLFSAPLVGLKLQPVILFVFNPGVPE